MTYQADIKAIETFPRVTFDGSRDDFIQFHQDLNERVFSSPSPSATVLKGLRPLSLEAATHHYYIQLCATKRQAFTDHSEVIMARELMQTPALELERRHPDFLRNINWSRTRALAERL